MASEFAETITELSKDSKDIITCTTTIPFGGTDPWLYNTHTKQFDISRGSSRKLLIASDEHLYNHRGFLVDPSKTVLIVIDMQNYFIHPTYRNHATGLAAVDPILSVLERCRQDNVQVAWLNWGITNGDLAVQPPAVQRGFSKALGWHIGLGVELPDGQGRCLFKGTQNADLYAPLKGAVQGEDLFFDKNRMSGLWSTEEPLHRYLRETGKKTLLFAGVNTDQCVFGTLSDAYHFGWDCILLGDCTGTMTERRAQELVEHNVATNMGFVIDSKALCESQLVIEAV